MGCNYNHLPSSIPYFTGDSLPRNEKTEIKTLFDLLKDYAEHASVQGLIYLTFSYQTLCGKAYWISIILFMLALGIYWSVILYNDWRGQQVLTTIATTALPINQIEFPAITFCSPGPVDFTNIL
jgi:hypothetical protein